MFRRILSIILSLALSGCYMDVGEDTGPGRPSPSSESGTGTVSSGGSGTSLETKVGTALVRGYAGLMALYVYLGLIAFGADSTSAALVALAFFNAVAFKLLPEVDPDKPLEVAPYLAESAVSALNDPAFVMPQGKTKEEALSAIVEGLFKGLSANSSYALGEADQKALLTSFVANATKGIDEAAFSDPGAAAAVIARAAVASLDEAGIAESRAGDIGGAALQSILASFPQAGVTGASAIDAAVAKVTRAGVAGLSASGVTNSSALDAAVLSLTKGITTGLEATGLTDAEQVAASEEIAENAAAGMTDAGFDENRISAMQSSVSASISEALAANGLSEADADQAKATATAKINDYLSTLGQ